jgi:hypothetical protein
MFIIWFIYAKNKMDDEDDSDGFFDDHMNF